MKLADHHATPRGRLFLFGGIGLGVLFMLSLMTHGFGLLGAREDKLAGPPALVRHGEKVSVPEGSGLRQHLVVAPAGGEHLAARLVMPAIVESDPARTAAVLSPLSGRVVELKVALGDRVKQGQVLALIDSPDLGQAYADYDKADATQQLASKAFDRQQAQLDLGTAAARDVDQARSDRAQAQAEFTRAQRHLRTLGVTPEHRPTLLPVLSPVNGSVTALSIARGNMLNDPTQPLLTVADLSSVWVSALVAEKDLGEVFKDQSAEISIDAYPGKVRQGRVLFVSDVLEPDSRRAKLRIVLENPDTALKPNMFASVTLAGTERDRVTVPTSALLMNNDRTSVFVATAPWMFERRIVHPRLEEGSRVALDDGVTAGESVVVQGGILLND